MDTTQFGLGRIELEDERDQEFLMRSALPSTTDLPAYRYYMTGPVLDQGATSECVGYAWKQWLRSYPIRQEGPDQRTIYCEAQQNDPWEGDCSNPRYEGTTVRAGAKALTARGHVSQYLWAFTAQDVARWLLSGQGPVVVGTHWYNSMFYPDPKTGIALVQESSGPAGGHAYLCVGYNSRTRKFRFVNSWGRKWGQNGRFWMHEDDLSKLLDKRGEACTATEVAVV